MNDNSKECAIKKKTQEKYPEFIHAIEGLPLEGLEKNLMLYAKYREETELAKKKDEALNASKEIVKELSAPYNEALNALKLKTAFLNVLIDERKDTLGIPSEAVNG